jgi:hypothetical protein
VSIPDINNLPSEAEMLGARPSDTPMNLTVNDAPFEVGFEATQYRAESPVVIAQPGEGDTAPG